MSDDHLLARARAHLDALTTNPDRHVGSGGNRQATAYFADTAASLGWQVALTPFECIDWEGGDGVLEADGSRIPLEVGPYSAPADAVAPLVAVDSVEALERLDARGRVLFLHGAVAAGQLMPRDYPFYYPDGHRRIYEAIDRAAPAALIAATGKDPGLAGGAYPFPLVEDGTFGVPHAYIKDVDAPAVLALDGRTVRVRIGSARPHAGGEHVVATLPGTGTGRVLLLAHIDSKLGSPGAIDNATGVVVLLLAAELLLGITERPTIELWPVNGEDHYAAFGERFWVETYAGRTDEITLGINVDGVGYSGSAAAVSCYGCHPETVALSDDLIAADSALVAGEPWFQGDHAVLAQSGVPAIAITSADMPAIWTTIAHTALDEPGIVDAETVVRVAEYVAAMAERSAGE